MTLTAILDDLQDAGTAQNRKVYARHGVRGALFGVSYANLRSLAKRLKRDHALARELWATGNHDARVLATLIADPQGADGAELDAWIADVDNYVLADAVAALVGQTSYAQDKAAAWRAAAAEWTSASGWNLVAQLAMRDKSMEDKDFEPLIREIERHIHARPNRTRYAMNGALIAIGLRSPALKQKAIEAARRIGRVEVDHGATGCQTPDAIPYIEKSWARRKK